MAAVHGDIRSVNATVIDVTTAKDVTTILQAIGAITRPCFVVQFLLIITTTISNTDELCSWISTRLVNEIAITNITLVQRDVGSTEYRTALTTTIGVTLDGRKTVDEARAVLLTDDDVCLTRNVGCGCSADVTRMVSHSTCPSAAIDVTCRAALDIGIGRGDEVCTKEVIDGSHSTGSIEVLIDLSTEQGDVGGAIDVTTADKYVVFLTKSSTISIVAYICTFVDDDIGVISLKSECVRGVFAVVYLCYSGNGILQIGRCVGGISECSREACHVWVIVTTERPGSLPFGISHIITLLIFCRLKCCDVFLYTLSTHHAASLSAAIDFPNLCAIIQVDLSIFAPGVGTASSTIDRSCCHAKIRMRLSDRDINIDFAIDGATLQVVTTIQCALHHCVILVINQIGISTMVIDRTLIYITRLIDVTTVCTGKDTADFNGGTGWYINYRATSNTLIQATAIGCTDLSASQVNDSSCSYAISISVSCCLCYSHAHTTVLAGSEHFQISKFRARVSKVHQHITPVLHQVFIRRVKPSSTLTSTEDLINLVADMLIRLEVDESIIHTWRCITGILRSIVIVTIASTKDIVHVALHILHVGRSCRYGGGLLRFIWRNREVCT